MKKYEGEDIKVNRRSTEKVHYESTLVQSISDKIDFLSEESKEILNEIDSTEFKQQLDEFDLEEFSEDTINKIDDIFDDISKFKDEKINTYDIPQDIKEQYRNTQKYLNRDGDYVRRAERKLDRLDSEKTAESYNRNLRAIELCDKAIDIRKDNFDAYCVKARALVNLARYDKAIDEFINALSIKDDLDVWLAIANTNRLKGDFDDAIEVYDSILEKYGNIPDPIKGKAYVYFDIGDYVNCDKMFKQSNSIKYLDEESFGVWSDCLEQLRNN